MRDLLADYRTETITELTKLYLKSCILKEYLFVFPFISKVTFKDYQFYNFISKTLKELYYDAVAPFLTNETEFLSLCTIALSEIQESLNILETNGTFDLIQDFPNIAFKQYETERDSYNGINTFDKNLHDEKYVIGNLYREFYIRVEDSQTTEARNEIEEAFLARYNEQRGVVNPTSFKNFVESWMGIMPQDRFLALVRNRFLGVRVVYNSPFHTTNSQNHKALYESILTESRYIYEKTNALAFKYDSNTTRYKFPLIIAKKEIMFPPSLGSMQSMIDYVNSSTFFSDVYDLSNRLWEDPNFSKLFNYHIPVRIFQSILFNNFTEKYYLLQEVMQENKVFQDLSGAIINLLNRIKFAEDPTNI